MCNGCSQLNECGDSLCRQISGSFRVEYLEKAKNLVINAYANEPWVNTNASTALSGELEEVYDLFVRDLGRWASLYAGNDPGAVGAAEKLFARFSADVSKVVSHYHHYLGMITPQ